MKHGTTRKRTEHLFRRLAFIIVFATAGAGIADVTWNGSSDGYWNTDANWELNTKPYQACGMIIFGTAGASNKTCTNNIGSTYNVSGMIFTNGGGYTLIEGGGAGNYRDLNTGIFSYGGSNIIGSGIFAGLVPFVVLATNSSFLTINDPMALGASTCNASADSNSAIIFNGNFGLGNIQLNGPGVYVLNSMSGSGEVYLNSGTVVLNQNNALAGQVYSGDNTLIASNGMRTCAPVYFGGNNSKTFTFGGTNDFIFNCPIGRKGTHPIVNVTNPAVRVSFTGASGYPNNNVATTKTGPGTLVIRGNTTLDANSSDGFTVTGGALLLVDGTNIWAVDGNQNNAITVTNGTLGGLRTVNNLGDGVNKRGVTIYPTGKINPGDPAESNGVGTLTLGTSGKEGWVTFYTNSTLKITMNDLSTSLLEVYGNLTLAAGTQLEFYQTPGTRLTNGVYTIVTNVGAFSGAFTNITKNTDDRCFVDHYANSVTLTFYRYYAGTVMLVR